MIFPDIVRTDSDIFPILDFRAANRRTLPMDGAPPHRIILVDRSGFHLPCGQFTKPIAGYSDGGGRILRLAGSSEGLLADSLPVGEAKSTEDPRRGSNGINGRNYYGSGLMFSGDGFCYVDASEDQRNPRSYASGYRRSALETAPPHCLVDARRAGRGKAGQDGTGRESRDWSGRDRRRRSKSPGLDRSGLDRRCRSKSPARRSSPGLDWSGLDRRRRFKPPARRSSPGLDRSGLDRRRRSSSPGLDRSGLERRSALPPPSQLPGTTPPTRCGGRVWRRRSRGCDVISSL